MFKAEPRSFRRLSVRPVDWCVLQAKIPVKVNPVSVLSQIWAYGLAVLLTFLVTLGCFPAITVRVSARHRRVKKTKGIEEGTFSYRTRRLCTFHGLLDYVSIDFLTLQCSVVVYPDPGPVESHHFAGSKIHTVQNKELLWHWLCRWLQLAQLAKGKKSRP
jgi:hypothetical protein